MFNTYQMVLCAVLSSFTSAAVSSLLWLRKNGELADAWAQDHLRQNDRIEELEAELDSAEIVTGDPMDSEELMAAVEAFIVSPQAYAVEKWQTLTGLSVVVRRKEVTPDA